MASKQEFAESLASYIRRNAMSPTVSSEVWEQLDNLTYSDSGKPLSNADKVEILQLADEEIRHPRVGKLRYVAESENSTAFLALMKKLTDRYKK